MFDHFFFNWGLSKISLQTGKQGPPMQKRTKRVKTPFRGKYKRSNSPR